ncbi:N-acetylmuramic acid 6-phosphate etherase [Bacillus sp. M6-12]|uniref:N-acetylmuramic acid 6-phosphate etherase n=1 Tax=Bacillus sp. M6-12 TaxID=2054166 RepID=UPI000C77638B|nr:N-acetylmuramic acid 6-phosphate etherase [Bacillus sp. M6-12]PLS16145.1 N-acetylmuramic acid 6-phosphate etherase [Bacillus sp. M6-12]
MENLSQLTTEMRMEDIELDTLSSLEIVKYMNEEDKKVAFAVEKELPKIAKAVDLITEKLNNGGRLFYIGAGTSGRLGILDASECPPTFGTDSSLVQGIIAGGPQAIMQAVENAEDSVELGREDIEKRNISQGDVVVGLAASGRTPYVIGALQEAKARAAATITISCNANDKISKIADVAINILVGPEVLAGSTRLKAGTAQKMALNMLSTGAMIRLGKVYGNLMVAVQATNEKLRERVKRIIMETTNVSYDTATKLSEQANGDATVAIIMAKTGLDAEAARNLLANSNGSIRKAIN